MPAEMNKPLTVSVERLLARKSYALFLVCSVCAVALLTWLTLGHFEKILLPQLLAKSNVIASSVRTTVDDAIKLGIPYEER